MSAFMCSDHHFRVLAVAIVLSGVKWRRSARKPPSFSSRCEELDHTARILAKENARSLRGLALQKQSASYRGHHSPSVDHPIGKLRAAKVGSNEAPSMHFFGGKDAPIGDDNATPKGAAWRVDKVRDHHSRLMIGVSLQRTGQANKRYSALMIYKALQCYEYQSCEHDKWEKSEAFRMYEAAIAHFAQVAIDVEIREAYERAPWTLEE